MSVVVVLPSRGRPGLASKAIRCIRNTAARVDTSVVLAVDEDDPEYEAYRALRFGGYSTEVNVVTLRGEETGNLVRATNTVSMRIAESDPTAIIANFGDDHHARSQGWDKRVLEALATPGVAYGDDLLQGEHIPTAPFISASIVLALGWYALPTCHHLYIDNAWRDVGAQTGTLRYLPDVVIEHLHPAAHKGKWDEGYERANNEAAMLRDQSAYEYWRKWHMAADIERVRQSLAVAA